MPLGCVVPVTHSGLVKTTVSKHSIPCSLSFFPALSLITCPPVLSLLTRHVVWMLQDICFFTFSLLNSTFLLYVLCLKLCSVYGRGTNGEKAEQEGLQSSYFGYLR